jgi:hypothetical protein
MSSTTVDYRVRIYDKLTPNDKQVILLGAGFDAGQASTVAHLGAADFWAALTQRGKELDESIWQYYPACLLIIQERIEKQRTALVDVERNHGLRVAIAESTSTKAVSSSTFSSARAIIEKPRHFVSRPELEVLLAKAREAKAEQPIFVLRSFDGVPGGTGKTTLACALAAQLRCEELFDGHHVLVEMRGAENHSDSDVKQAIRSAKRHVVERCGSCIANESDDMELERVYRSVLSSVGLLIIDDVWDSSPVRALLLLDDVTFSRDTPLCAIVTSRETIALACSVEMKIGVVASDAAILLLKQHGKNSRFNDDELRRVAEACGQIPLALYLVGGAMAGWEDLNIAEMLESLISKKTDDAMNAPSQLSWRALDSVGQVALQQSASFPFSFTKEAFECAFGQSNSIHLTTLLSRGFLMFGDANGRYSMHDVTRAFVLRSTIDVVSMRNRVQYSYVDIVTRCDTMFKRNVHAAIDLFVEERAGIVWTMQQCADVEVLLALACVFGERSTTCFLDELCLPLLTRAVDVGERVHGREHEQTLRAKHNLAWAIWMWDCASVTPHKHGEAEQRFRDVLEVEARVLGDEHPQFLLTCHHLARTLLKQRKYDEAEKTLRYVLAVRERLLGVEHADTLKTKHDLAPVLHGQRKYDEAETMFRNVLIVQERVLGVQHASTLTTKHNLARAVQYQGKYDQAEKMFRDVLALQERVLGVEHVNTLKTQHCLLRVQRHQRK